jgi:hypothetical protein
VLALLAYTIATAAGAAQDFWTVTLHGSDVTTAAAPREHAGALIVNVTALSSALQIGVEPRGDEVQIRDAQGGEWLGRHGQSMLSGIGRRRFLSVPLSLEGATVYLPADATAELAGLQLRLDRTARRAVLVSHDAEAASSWDSFTIGKTAEELAQHERIYGASSATPRGRARNELLPPAHDTLRLRTGLGYVRGEDWGMDLLATGRVAGLQADSDAFLTYGDRGLEFMSGRFTLSDPDLGWSATAGDLYSDAIGRVRGLRTSLRIGERHTPTVSLYLDTFRNGEDKPVLSFRDELSFGKTLMLGGEIATDGSYFVRGRASQGPLSVYGYWLDRSALGSDSHGIEASLGLWRRINLRAGLSRSGEGADQTERLSFGLRVPLRTGWDLSLEQTSSQSESFRHNIQSASLFFPVSRVRAQLRYQHRSTELFIPRAEGAGWFGSDQHDLAASAMYARGALSFSVNGNTSFRPGGSAKLNGQFHAGLRLSRRIQVQAGGSFSELFDPDQLRLRLDVGLSGNTSLVAEYGRLSPFQGGSVDPDAELFKLTLRRAWNVKTPARGGAISGVVKDQLGHPLRDVGVSLGRYTAVTDAEGRYAFKNVPDGAYELQLDEKGLPADYASKAQQRTLQVGRRTRELVEFGVIPLSSIHGLVYQDRNGNGTADPDEGIAGVAVLAGARATATGADGSFSLYNLEPGEHTVRLGSHLPGHLVAVPPAEAAVELLPGQPVTGLELRLQERRREIVFQDRGPSLQSRSAPLRPTPASSPTRGSEAPSSPEPQVAVARNIPRAPSSEAASAGKTSKSTPVPAGRADRDAGPGVPSRGALKAAADEMAYGRSVEIRLEGRLYHVLADGKPVGAFRLLSDVPVADGALGSAYQQMADGATRVRIFDFSGSGG